MCFINVTKCIRKRMKKSLSWRWFKMIQSMGTWTMCFVNVLISRVHDTGLAALIDGQEAKSGRWEEPRDKLPGSTFTSDLLLLARPD